MEVSYYNVVCPLDEGAVAYHTRRRVLAELSQEETEMLMNPDQLTDAGLAADLQAAGFLVPSAQAEADEVLYRQHQYRNNNRIFELTVTPSRRCNFSCDYCYVPKRPGVMDDSTQRAIIAFVRDCYERAPFREFRMNWYGGEPLLSIDVMEKISGPVIEFCRRHDIRYLGHVLSNGSLADKEMCRRLVENCGIVSVMPSISGYGDMHDYQRPAKDGKKYFDIIMNNIDCMLDAGITVHVNYVTNRNNIEECTQLAKRLCHKEGLITRLSKTGAFGKEHIVLKDGKDTPIQLFEPEEFGPQYRSFLRELNLDAAGYQEVLKPIPLYCAALVNHSWFIDETGDVFSCMVDMDYPERALFNLNRWVAGDKKIAVNRFLEYANLEPARDSECRTCRILPICQGGCYEKYLATGKHACHNLKYCIEGVVLDYHKAMLSSGKCVDIK